MTAPWDRGAALARARRPLPSHEAIMRDWACDRFDAYLFALGYLEVKVGHFSIDTRLTIERAYARARQAG